VRLFLNVGVAIGWMVGLGTAVTLVLAAGCASDGASVGETSADGGPPNPGGAAGGPMGGSGGALSAGGSAGNAGGTAGSGGAGTGAGGCASFAQTYCAQQLACRPVEFQSFWYKSLDACLAEVSRTCALELSAHGTSATSGTLAGCTQAVAKQSCGEFLTAAPPDCLVPGTLPDGAGCEFSSQCQSSLCDVGSNLCGKCARRVTAGGRCVERGDLRFLTCEAGLICKNSTCLATVPLGGACDRQASNCAPPFVCFNSQCVEPIPPGGTCNDRDQCAGEGYCEYQSPGVGMCTPNVYVGLGAACTESGPNLCSAGTNCKAPDGSYTNDGTCVAAAGLGQPCTLNEDCVDFCVNGTCQTRSAASTCP